MACPNKARKRRNIIAFRLSDEEKAEVEAKIAISGLPKGEYYIKAILEQPVTASSGVYQSARLAHELNELRKDAEKGSIQALKEILEILKLMTKK